MVFVLLYQANVVKSNAQLKMTGIIIKVPSVITKRNTLKIKSGIKGRGINNKTKAQQIKDKKNPAQLFFL